MSLTGPLLLGRNSMERLGCVQYHIEGRGAVMPYMPVALRMHYPKQGTDYSHVRLFL